MMSDLDDKKFLKMNWLSSEIGSLGNAKINEVFFIQANAICTNQNLPLNLFEIRKFYVVFKLNWSSDLEKLI